MSLIGFHDKENIVSKLYHELIYIFFSKGEYKKVIALYDSLLQQASGDGESAEDYFIAARCFIQLNDIENFNNRVEKLKPFAECSGKIYFLH
ncbi:MAG: hypothetical protein ABJA79_09905, partial [Parafilimonas sp.]